MSGTYKNIFEEFFKVKAYLKENRDIYTDKAQELMQEFENYLNTFNWAKDGADRSLYLRAGQKLKLTQIAEVTKVPYTTLQGKVQRLNYKICGLLFDGEPFGTDILSKSDKELTQIINRIKVAELNFNYFTEFDDDILLRIQLQANKQVSSEEFTKEELYLALAVFAKFSSKAISSWFERLNPKAVAYIDSLMQENKCTPELQAYLELQKKSSFQEMNSKAIEHIDKIMTEGK